jgi:hypothetical protein
MGFARRTMNEIVQAGSGFFRMIPGCFCSSPDVGDEPALQAPLLLHVVTPGALNEHALCAQAKPPSRVNATRPERIRGGAQLKILTARMQRDFR